MEKQNMRDSLIADVETELKKDAGDIDGDFIDRRIDELYALDGVSPPSLNDEDMAAAVRTIRTRAAWKRNRAAVEARKRRFVRRVVRGAVAACCLAVFAFSANYLVIMATGSCIPSRAGIKTCCGTEICPCAIARAEKTGRAE
jgi:hypothetical protein